VTVHEVARESTTYPALLAAFEPHVIRDEVQAERVREQIDALTDLPVLTTDQREFVALLGHLLCEWERVTEQPFEVSPQEVVASLLEDNGLRQRDLVPAIFPTRSAVSDFLAGRRALSYERVMKLADFFHVSPAVFFPIPGPAVFPAEV
jgi:HTH-type transcriptional regulator/antitoxin HigA